MTKQELELIHRNYDEKLKKLLKNIEDLEKNSIVKEYLEQLNKINAIKRDQEYLSKLEIGEDDIIFENKGRSINKKYGLEFLLNCALSIKYYGSDQEPNTGIILTEEEILAYLENGEKILRSTKKYDGDQLADNPYNYEIYKNLSNTNILEEQEFNDLLKIFSKDNKSSYHILDKYQFSQVVLLKNKKIQKETSLLVLARNIPSLKFIDPNTLTKREQDAFFGIKAQEILGVNLINKKTTSK